MRDRLIELILECSTYTPEYSEQARLHAEYLAQHLLNEGVIVPPCKVGDEVYWIGNKESIVKTYYVACVEINIFEGRIHTVIHTKINKDNFYSDEHFSNYQFGKYLFFTREEAEKALAERSENGK